MMGKVPADIREKRRASKARTKKSKIAQGESNISRLANKGWQLLVGVGLVAGLIAVYFQFRPVVEISTPLSTQDDATELFSNPFVLNNKSAWFSVHDLHAICQIYRIWRGTPSFGAAEENNVGEAQSSEVPELAAGEQHSVPCYEPVASQLPIIRAEVGLIIDYKRPWFYLGHTTNHRKYRAIINDKRAYWTPF